VLLLNSLVFLKLFPNNDYNIETYKKYDSYFSSYLLSYTSPARVNLI